MKWVICWLLCPLLAWAGPSLKPSKEQFTTNESVVIEFSELPGNKKDWIVISLPTATAFKPGDKRQFTNGQIAGNLDFGKIDVGKYEARLYFNYPTGGYKIQSKMPFEVIGTPLSEESNLVQEITLTTDKEKYTINEPVTIKFTGAPGDQQDYISIPRPNAHPTFQPQNWQYLNGKKSGELVFDGLISGEWQARLHFKNTGYKIQKSLNFTVSNPESKISTDKTSYTTQEPIKVIFSALPGFKRDWISVIMADKDDGSFDKTENHTWETNALKEGVKEFPPLTTAGSYQVRAYYDYPTGGYEVKARAEFTVIDPNDKDDEDEEKTKENTTDSTEKPSENTSEVKTEESKSLENKISEMSVEKTDEKDELEKKEVKKLESLSSISENSPSTIKEKNFFEKFEKLEQEHQNKTKETHSKIDDPIPEEVLEFKENSQKKGKIVLPDILLPDLPQWK